MTRDDLTTLRRAVAAVLEREVAADVADLEGAGDAVTDWVRRLADLGYLDAGLAPAAGGLGLAGEVSVVEELARTWGSLALAVVPALLLARARRAGDPSAAVVPAAVAISADDGPGQRRMVVGAGPLLVLPAAAVLEATPDGEPLAHDGFRAVGFRAVELPAAAPGSPPEGERLVAAHRILLAAIGAGLASGAVDVAARYVGERRQFGRPIGSFGEIRDMVARAATRAASVRHHVLGAAGAWDEGTATAADATTAYLAAVDAAGDAGDRMQHAHGGYGHMAEYPIGRYARDARMLAALAGPLAELRDQVAVAAGLPARSASPAA